jgi:hypothetical protein
MKILMTIAMIFLTVGIYAQKVDTVTYNNHKYSVGDTIKLNVGSGTNGQFVSSSVTFGMSTYPKLSSDEAGKLFIIKKITKTKDKMNETINLIVKHNAKGDVGMTTISIDLKQAILLKEIVVK